MDTLVNIFGDRVPDKPARAWVGQFADNFLGDYDKPEDAVKVARNGGYAYVHLTREDGSSDIIDTRASANA